MITAALSYQIVLDFWFEEIDPKLWWAKDTEFDQSISKRFVNLRSQASHCELFAWRTTALGRLAEIIVLDQFSRNIYRGSPNAFAYDPLALALSQEAIAIGADKGLSSVQRSFLYMPLMHSESMLIHEQALVLYENNGGKANLEFEKKHYDIIKCFGRYPHRNAILKRDSTAEENVFLKLPGSEF